MVVLNVFEWTVTIGVWPWVSFAHR